MTEMKMARQAYGEILAELGAENERIVALDADLSSSTKTSLFAKQFPDRFFNCGVAEQNMVGVASGLAASGMIPFISTFSLFCSGRAWEQIRNTVAISDLNVKIVVTHGGISVGPDGASHQSLEDIALMRVISNMVVIVPCDAPETVAAVKAAVAYTGPVFIRLGRPKVPSIWQGDTFTIGKATRVAAGTDVSVIACGVMVEEARQAQEILKAENISLDIINMATIKPLDTDMLVDSVKKTGCVVSCEEHSVIGGLGGAVAEALASKYPVPQVFVGVKDRFGQSGKPEELMAEYELDAASIATACRAAIAKKQ